MLEKAMKDCLIWERLHIGTGEQREKKGPAKTCDDCNGQPVPTAAWREVEKSRGKLSLWRRQRWGAVFKICSYFFVSCSVWLVRNWFLQVDFVLPMMVISKYSPCSYLDPQIFNNFSPPYRWGGDVIEWVDGHLETSEGQSTTLPLCIFFPILKIKEVLFLSSDTPQPHIKGHIKENKGVKFLIVLVVSLKTRIRDFTKSNSSFLDTFLILCSQMMWRSQLVPRGCNFLSLVFFSFKT